VNIHFPDFNGGVDKSGRSAGLSTAAALTSFGSEVDLPLVAMTGELTISG
jgi:ATP-dependent Lon protease